MGILVFVKLESDVHILVSTDFTSYFFFVLQLVVKGDIRCEASYYNEKPSLWEPLLEPLETSKGRLEQWVISVEVYWSSCAISMCLTCV